MAILKKQYNEAEKKGYLQSDDTGSVGKKSRDIVV